MTETPMILSSEDMLEIESSIVTTEGMGARIRQILGGYRDENHGSLVAYMKLQKGSVQQE